MKKRYIFILLLLQLVLLKTIFSQSIRLKTKSNNGYYIEMHQFKCKFIKHISKTFIDKNDTIITLENNINYVNISIWNKTKEFYFYFPLYIDSNIVTLEFSINDSIVNDIDKLQLLKLYGSIKSIEYTDFFKNYKIDILENNGINIEDIKKYYNENQENIYALYLLSISEKYSFTYKRFLDSVNNECKGKKYFLESFKELDSIQIYSKTYLDFNKFIPDLIKNSKALSKSYKFSKNDFSKEGNIYFWGSWCKPCLKELLQLSIEEKKNKNNFFISLDSDPQKCINAAKKVGLTINVYLTKQEWLKKYQIDLIPTTIYYNNQKHILKKVL